MLNEPVLEIIWYL